MLTSSLDAIRATRLTELELGHLVVSGLTLSRAQALTAGGIEQQHACRIELQIETGANLRRGVRSQAAAHLGLVEADAMVSNWLGIEASIAHTSNENRISKNLKPQLSS